MLQPSRAFSQPRLCSQCFHTLSRRLYPVEVQPPLNRGVGINKELDIESRPSEHPEEKNAAILRTYKPRTPGVRHLKRPINDHLYKGRPYLPLTFSRRGQHIGGRNKTGKVTVRHRGAGAKRRIRTIDFNRKEPGRRLVERIEHDPGRNAHIALLSHAWGGAIQYSYIVAPQGMRAGERVESFRSGIPSQLLRDLGGNPDAGMLAAKTAFRGNCLPLHMVPPGTTIYNIGLRKNGPAQLCRSAGTFATVVSKNDGHLQYADYVDVKLKSGEVRRIQRDCCATIGVASNVNFNRRQLGKAGRKRWLGIRPTVRGLAMNASDHPHGGGRGKSKGNVHPVSIWGQLVSNFNVNLWLCILIISQTKSGYKTRTKSNVNRYVVTPRPRSEGKKAKKAKKKKENR